MKRILGLVLTLVFFLGFGFTAQAQAPLTPPAPLTLVNGSLVVQADYFAGDTMKNGAGALATITGGVPRYDAGVLS